jgi:hypothetical protein
MVLPSEESEMDLSEDGEVGPTQKVGGRTNKRMTISGIMSVVLWRWAGNTSKSANTVITRESLCCNKQEQVEEEEENGLASCIESSSDDD